MKKDLSAALAGLKPHDSVVVYCVTRKETEEVSACLNRLGFKAAFYHAQLPHQQRSRVHEQVRRVSDGANGTSACVCEVPEAPLYVTMCVCVCVWLPTCSVLERRTPSRRSDCGVWHGYRQA